MVRWYCSQQESSNFNVLQRLLGALRSQMDKTGYSERQVGRQGQAAPEQVMGSEQLGGTEEDGRWMEE